MNDKIFVFNKKISFIYEAHEQERLTIATNQLIHQRKYLILLQTSTLGSLETVSNMTIWVAGMPSGGSCSVEPAEGK